MNDTKKNEIAVLMAAGLGTRMSRLSEKTPKPLIKVFGKPMIETIIDALKIRGVKQIYVVVGYMKERFEYLPSLYPDVALIVNDEYKQKNNISSIYAASSVMENENCFICETDLYISDSTLLCRDIDHSCYFGKYVSGHSDDWVFDTDENTGLITRIGKHGDNRYNMTGIAYLKKRETNIIVNAVREAYKEEGHENLFWDDIANKHVKELCLKVYPIQSGAITELDSEEELAALDPDYLNYNL